MIDIRRAGDRLTTETGWLESRHSFSFGQHYDPANTHHGLLLVNNDDVVSPGQGFDTHPHRDMEIVTWVLDGALVHQDSLGHTGAIYPGLAQRMSAGTGILHSEKNDAAVLTRPVRFVQMWVMPDASGLTPGYQQLDIDAELAKGGLIPVASGMDRHRDHAAITINNRHAALHVARLTAQQQVNVPDAPFVHVFVTNGAVELEGAGVLGQGDAVRITEGGGLALRATAESEVLIWEMHSRLGA